MWVGNFTGQDIKVAHQYWQVQAQRQVAAPAWQPPPCAFCVQLPLRAIAAFDMISSLPDLVSCTHKRGMSVITNSTGAMLLCA